MRHCLDESSLAKEVFGLVWKEMKIAGMLVETVVRVWSSIV